MQLLQPKIYLQVFDVGEKRKQELCDSLLFNQINDIVFYE